MENPIEHFDLGFVNYTQHPENKDYVVFRFADSNRANSFREALIVQKIWFEEANEDKKQVTYTMFGLHKTDYNKAQKINIFVEAKHKKFIIPGKFLRWSIVLFGMTMITLATIGYFLKESTKSKNTTLEQTNEK